MWWDTYYGVKNLKQFFWSVWEFRKWDYTGMLSLIQIAAKDMQSCQENGIHDGSKRYARQLLIVKELSRRLQKDNYFENAGYGDGKNWENLSDVERTLIATRASVNAKNDAEYLGKMFKFVQHWWE
jgi:hypothetical protein